MGLCQLGCGVERRCISEPDHHQASLSWTRLQVTSSTRQSHCSSTGILQPRFQLDFCDCDSIVHPLALGKGRPMA